jgi:hypothetical protein
MEGKISMKAAHDQVMVKVCATVLLLYMFLLAYTYTVMLKPLD